MDVSRLFLHVTPTGLQKVARRNCASSLVELAAAHAGGPGASVTPAMLTDSVTPQRTETTRSHRDKASVR